MKKFICVLSMSVMLACVEANAQTKVVGVIEDGTPTLTVDKGRLISIYNAKLLKLSGIDAKFTDVSIKTADNKAYYLVFVGLKYRSTFSVSTEGASLIATAGTSCTTSDCASEPSGCVPTLGDGTIYCSPCANQGKCTKTTSTESLID